jgi:hypothetical protein
VDDRLGVHRRIVFVTEAKSNVDDVVRRATTKEHAKTRK